MPSLKALPSSMPSSSCLHLPLPLKELSIDVCHFVATPSVEVCRPSLGHTPTIKNLTSPRCYKEGNFEKLRGEMSIPPQQQPQGGLPPPSSQQQAQAGGVPVGQGQPPPTGTGDGWRTPEKRQLVIRKISEAVKMFPDVLARNPSDVETSIFTRAKSEHEYMNMVGKIVLSIKHKGLMQQQQHQQAAAAAAAGGGGGGTGWTGQGGMEWGMRPNLPPQPGGGYPSFPPGGHMPPYGGMPPRMIPSYPMHGPPPPHPAMQPHMMHQMPPHNMGVMPMRQPYNMMRGAHPPPQRASLATNMVGSGEQVVSAVPNPSFPVTAPGGNVQEMPHPPSAPSPFPNHPSPYHAPPPSTGPPPPSIPPQSSAHPLPANSPKPPQSVPSPRVNHPIPSPGTPWNPNSPSNTASPSQQPGPTPSNQPSLTPEGSNAVLLKLQELQCYIPLLARMIDRLTRGGEKDSKGRSDQLTKLTSLYNVLQSKNMKVPLQTLEKCHVALKKIFEKDTPMTSQPQTLPTQAPPSAPPPPTTTTSNSSIPSSSNAETSNGIVTTSASSVTPPRPPVPPTPPMSSSMSLLDFKILHSPPPLSSYLQPVLEERQDSDPLDRLPVHKKRKLDEQAAKSFILGIKRELIHLNNFTIRKISPKNSLELNDSLCLECTLVDDSLPAMPPLIMTISPDYPSSSPHVQFNTDSPPPVFMKELEETMKERLAKCSYQYTISYVLETLESTLLQIMAKELRD